MDLSDKISRALKEKFPRCSLDLSFLSEGGTKFANKSKIYILKTLLEKAKDKKEEIKAKLEQTEFIEQYLSDCLSSAIVKIESNNNSDNGSDSEDTRVHEGLKKTLSAIVAPSIVGLSDDIIRSNSAPLKRKIKPSSDFNTTWMAKITGTPKFLGVDSDDDLDDENSEQNDDKQHLTLDVKGRRSPLNSDQLVTDQKNSNSPECDDLSKQVTHTCNSGLNGKANNSDENISVHTRIRDLERAASQKDSLKRNNSERPKVLPKPSKPRISKPKRKLNGFDRDPENVEKLLSKCTGEPTSSVSHQNKGSKDIGNQQCGINNDKPGESQHQALINEIKSINFVSGEEDRTYQDSTQHGDGDPGKCQNVNSGKENEQHVTVITVGQNCDDNGEDMKRFRSKKSSSGDDNVQITAYKRISTDSDDVSATVVEEKDTLAVQEGAGTLAFQKSTDTKGSKFRAVACQKLSEQMLQKNVGNKGTGVRMGNSNIFNTSINVLLTQNDTNMNEDSSSDEDDDEDDRHNHDHLDVQPRDTDGSSVGSVDSRIGNSTSSSELSNRNSNQISPFHHRKKISTVSNISIESDTVFPHSDDDQMTREEHDGKDGDDDSQDNNSCESLDLAEKRYADPERQKKLEMRKMLLQGILKSELIYVANLNEMIKFKRRLQMEDTNVCSREDITTIFYKVEEIYAHHEKFVKQLQDAMDDWTDEQVVGEIFKEMIFFLLPVYSEYIDNSKLAKECVAKCSNADSDFRRMAINMKISSGQSEGKEVTTLEEILFKPVQRLQRNTLVLHDLLKFTPEDHPDVKSFKQALNLVDHNLKHFGAEINSKVEDHHLVKSGFVVEMVGHSRKLRYLFLFTDVVVCTKHKISGRHKVKSFECKWFIPVCETIVQDIEEKTYECKDDIGTMKKKIVSLKAELRDELKKNDSTKEGRWIATKGQRAIEKLKKKIEEQEASLVLASPHLAVQLKSSVRDECQYTLLLSNDFEREEWKEAIEKQQKQHCRMSFDLQRQMSIHEIQTMISDSKQLPQVNNIGTVLMKKDDEMLNGNLNVTIHTLTGLDQCCDTYCQLELDSYGHFFMKAKTGLVKDSQDPKWNEDFELDLDGSQTLRILCYRKTDTSDQLIGRSALELSTKWLKNSFKEEKISMNNIALTISVRHTPASKTLKRAPSRMQGGMFGVKLSTVTRQEGKTVPTIVTTCVKEIEARGIDEVGIYRVSGVTSEVQRLKKTFDKNLNAGKNLVSSCDINAVTGVLKLYFRELPEPLFTDQQYKAFVTTVGLSDVDTKHKCMLQLLHSLPDENYYTIVTVIDHLVTIGKRDKENKMSFSNLATVFGPTLLHPAVSDAKLTTAEIMQGAQDVFLQADVVSFFLNLVGSGKSIRRTANN